MTATHAMVLRSTQTANEDSRWHDVTPWWKALKIRQEILNASGQIDDVQMSLFQAVHGAGADRPPYADAGYYGEITHPTERLIDLLTEIAVRIGGGDDYLKARAVTRLDQGMGGGKSHACIGAFHLAANPEALLGTELGQQVAERAKAKIGRGRCRRPRTTRRSSCCRATT